MLWYVLVCCVTVCSVSLCYVCHLVIVWCYRMSCCVLFCGVVFCHVMLCFAMPCSIMLSCYVMSCDAMLCPIIVRCPVTLGYPIYGFEHWDWHRIVMEKLCEIMLVHEDSANHNQPVGSAIRVEQGYDWHSGIYHKHNLRPKYGRTKYWYLHIYIYIYTYYVYIYMYVYKSIYPLYTFWVPMLHD